MEIMSYLEHFDIHLLNEFLLTNTQSIHVNTIIDTLHRTMLHCVVMWGDYVKVRYLLSCGADVHIYDHQSNSVLYFAMTQPKFFHSHAIIHLLYEAGVEINHQNIQGQTALHRACILGDLELIQLLLQQSCCAVDLVDHKQQLAIQYIHSDQIELVIQIFKRYAYLNIDSHHRMWALYMSCDFVDALFR